MVLSSVIVSINGIVGGPGPEPGLVDFTEFTAVDENADLTIITSKVSWDTMRRDAVTYVYKDYGVDYFENFLINFEVKIDDIMNDAGGDIIVISNTIGTLQDQVDGGNGIYSRVYGGGGSSPNLRFLLKDISGSVDSITYVLGGSSSDLLYCTVMKTGNLAVCKFFSDSERANLLEQLTYEDVDVDGAYRYASITNRDATSDTPTDTWTGYTQNWEIIETAGYDGGAAYEDIDEYTFVNSEGKLAAYNTTIVWNRLHQSDDFYAYKDYGAAYFNNFDIEWNTEMFLTQKSTPHVVLIALGNDIGTWETFLSQDVGLIVDLWRPSNGITSFRVRDFNGDVQDISTTVVGDVNRWGPLYFRLERTGFEITCKIYDDSDRTSLIETLTIMGSSTQYRYMYVVNSRDTGAVVPCSGQSRDFEIKSH
jgi:hypothetical protein